MWLKGGRGGLLFSFPHLASLGYFGSGDFGELSIGPRCNLADFDGLRLPPADFNED